MRNIGKSLFIISLIISAYFIFLRLDYYFFKIHSITLGEIRELITLPIIGISYILTIATLVLWIRHKCSFPSYLFFAFTLWLLNSLSTLSVWL